MKVIWNIKMSTRINLFKCKELYRWRSFNWTYKNWLFTEDNKL